MDIPPRSWGLFLLPGCERARSLLMYFTPSNFQVRQAWSLYPGFVTFAELGDEKPLSQFSSNYHTSVFLRFEGPSLGLFRVNDRSSFLHVLFSPPNEPILEAYSRFALVFRAFFLSRWHKFAVFYFLRLPDARQEALFISPFPFPRDPLSTF